MCEVDGDKPDEMYKQAKRSLKKYYGNSSITNSSSGNDSFTKVIKQEPLFVDPEYESMYHGGKEEISLRDNIHQIVSPNHQ